jgi:hypothetical protein
MVTVEGNALKFHPTSGPPACHADAFGVEKHRGARVGAEFHRDTFVGSAAFAVECRKSIGIHERCGEKPAIVHLVPFTCISGH